MKARHAIGIALAYAAIGAARGIYLVGKYPNDQRDGLWWLRAIGAWPYDTAVDLFMSGSIG